jgi:Ser/Thr protein kinase RdoA (MazF antagonist)
MDDQQTYLLNGLITRHFGIGRIVRFRQVQRGRQAESYELFTAQEKEYLVHLYPPAFPAADLEFSAQAVNALDQNRFSVMPFLPSKLSTFVTEGPQGGHMLLALAPTGTAISPAEYTRHDISQVGLRLAWMHRLLREQIPAPQAPLATSDLFQRQFFDPAFPRPALTPLQEEKFPQLLALARTINIHGWTHGDITPAALLHDGDRQLRTVTDWALLHWGCPLEDVVDAFLFLSTHKGKLDRSRGSAFLIAYDSLVPLRSIAWTPIIANWCMQRMLSNPRRPLAGESFSDVLREPERLAVTMAGCLTRL